MKLIIIEGPDNCGKDTLISKILEQFPTTTIIHCSKPFSKQYSDIEQDLLFDTYINQICNNIYNTHSIILNRGFHGEYVYGVLYRNRGEISVTNMINNLEQKLLNKKIQDNSFDIYYIQLMSSNPELLLKNEDGKSLSEGDIKKITEECKRFTNIFEKSKLNKKIVYINNGDSFRSRESILNEVLNFVNK